MVNLGSAAKKQKKRGVHQDGAQEQARGPEPTKSISKKNSGGAGMLEKKNREKTAKEKNWE